MHFHLPRPQIFNPNQIIIIIMIFSLLNDNAIAVCRTNNNWNNYTLFQSIINVVLRYVHRIYRHTIEIKWCNFHYDAFPIFVRLYIVYQSHLCSLFISIIIIIMRWQCVVGHHKHWHYDHSAIGQLWKCCASYN